jgi:sec-independent protein translocase protein TatC
MPRRQTDQMPFLDHLEELRIRIFWMLGALVVGFFLSIWLITQFGLIDILQRPMLKYTAGQQLTVLGPMDSFRILLSTSLILAIAMALPVIVYHIWSFLAPGLYDHEKRLMVPVLVGATVLFAAGVALSFFIVLPITLKFLNDLTLRMGLKPDYRAGDYFGFLIRMCLAFGLVFELPIVVVALTALRIVTPKVLSRFRRHAFVGCLVLAAFVTPGSDPVSLAALTIPLYLLYELSIVLSTLLYRRQMRRANLETIGGLP